MTKSFKAVAERAIYIFLPLWSRMRSFLNDV